MIRSSPPPLKRWATRRITRLLWVLPAGAAAHYTYYLLKISELNVPWHLFLQVQTLYVGLAVLGYLLVHRLQTGTTRSSAWEFVLYVVFAVSLGCATFFYAGAKAVRRPNVALCFKVGEWIDRNIPEGTRLAMFDSFATSLVVEGRPIIDLNGLVGDAELADLARAKKKAEMIDRYGCDYVVTWITRECAASRATRYVHLSEPATTEQAARLAVVDATVYKRALPGTAPGDWPCP